MKKYQKRSVIDRAIMEFEQVLARQDRTEIEKARKQLTRVLDEIEINLGDKKREKYGFNPQRKEIADAIASADFL